MSARIAFADVVVGTELPAASYPIDRLTLVKYAGASGDFNTIHWNERIAVEVGLPNVIAHGMLTMAEAVRIVTDWAGDPGSVVEYGVRFTRPVVVPNDDSGVTLEVTAKVTELLEGNRVKIAITAKFDEQTVLGRAQAVVQLS
ncbi:MAG: MaoC family dehydratase [Candidatus Nanopelagicales bacterium]|nr:MaoC family dehydratase [Candidatus Nanopelagicales bacterium]